MSDRSFAPELPVPFVLRVVGFPTSAELAYGFLEGFLCRSSVVDIALAKLSAGVDLATAEERIALLLPDEFDHVDGLVEDLQVDGETSEQRARLWLLLVLAWVLEYRSEFDDPLGVVELLYSDFDYPQEIEGLVRFMPVQAGQEVGVEALNRRWESFVDRVSEDYRGRSRLMVAASPEI